MNREAGWPLATLLFTLLAVLGQLGGLLPANWWVLPWILSLVLFGLPHGAIDHEVALKLWTQQPAPGWALGVILSGYLGLSLLVFAGWFLAPAVIFGGFILLTWAHWGLADLWWSWERDPRYFRSRPHRGVFALWRGALPMLVPLASDPGAYRQTAEATCRLFLPPSTSFSWVESDAARLTALGVVLLLGLADFTLARGPWASRGRNAAEGLSLLVFFGALPALVSIGFYFAFWHGLRHVLRLRACQGLSWAGFALHATPATLGALGLVGALALTTTNSPRAGGDEMLGLYLAAIAALTVPHAVVVTWLDLRVGLWESPRRPDGAGAGSE